MAIMEFKVVAQRKMAEEKHRKELNKILFDEFARCEALDKSFTKERYSKIVESFRK